MMKDTQTGFTLYLANTGVVHAAVRRLKVWPSHPDYDDLVEEGMLIYIAYYQHYRDAVRTTPEQIKFNKLAGLFVYYGLLKIIAREHRRLGVQELSARKEPPAEIDPQDMIMRHLDKEADAVLIVKLRGLLSQREQEVFDTMYDQALTRSETRMRLGLSQSNLTNLLHRIHTKYQKLKAAETLSPQL